jgi:CHAT domain-containing protein
MARALLCAAAALLASMVQAAGEPDCAPDFVEQLGRIRRHIGARELTAARTELDGARARMGEEECPHARLRLDLVDGQLLVDEGRLAEADERLRGLALPPGASWQVETEYLYTVGGLAYQLGQYRRARDQWERLLDLDRAAANPRLVASDLYNIASTYVAESTGEESRAALAARFREALDAYEKSGSAASVAKLHVELGKLLGGTEGRAHLERARELATTPEVVTTALGALAVERLRDDPGEAGRLIGRALAVAETAWAGGNPWPLLHHWADRLPVRWATLPRQEAIADSLAALRHIENLRREQSDREVRAGLFSVWTEAYHWLAGRLLEDAVDSPERPDLALAFHVAEHYRARVLADSLGATHSEPAAVADGGAANEGDEGLFTRLDEIRASLADDEALLAFQVAPWTNVYGRFAGGSWLLAVSRGGARAYRLPGRGPLERRVRLYLGLLARRGVEGEAGGDAEGEAAARLYQDLLAPALGELSRDVDKLVLVPDGELHLLPFSSLRAAADAPPLAARYQLSLVPSATLWRHWRRSGPRAPAPAALVLADPLPGGVAAAPLRAALGPLPFAAEEGRMVAARVRGGSLLRLGAEASEAFIKQQDLRRFGLVHFAAHAVVDDAYPERSAVLLAPGSGEDGELRAREIADLDLRNGLVVLSVCRGASGNVLQGEGVMSLARAFFQAGARTVVGSLWPLDDREAGLLFDAFYRQLARGRPAREALQRAQEDLRAAGLPPAAWAGVVLLGDGAWAPLPRPGSGWVWGLGAAAVLAAAWAAARHRRRLRE